jgi:hypothetical protein
VLEFAISCHLRAPRHGDHFESRTVFMQSESERRCTDEEHPKRQLALMAFLGQEDRGIDLRLEPFLHEMLMDRECNPLEIEECSNVSETVMRAAEWRYTPIPRAKALPFGTIPPIELDLLTE